MPNRVRRLIHFFSELKFPGTIVSTFYISCTVRSLLPQLLHFGFDTTVCKILHSKSGGELFGASCVLCNVEMFAAAVPQIYLGVSRASTRSQMQETLSAGGPLPKAMVIDLALCPHMSCALRCAPSIFARPPGQPAPHPAPCFAKVQG